MQTLERLREQGKRVVGYGATSKSTTVINYCGITPRHVEFISDTTPIKQGRLSPGAHIPVRPYGEFAKRLSGLCAAVRLESRRRNSREGSRLHCRGRTLDRLCARGAIVS